MYDFPRESTRITDKLNPQQKEAVTYGDGPLLIFAGAGSGKTRVITNRIAWLVSRGVHPAEILAITFTNKAANEMKDRLETLLGMVAQRMWVGTFHSMLLRILRRHAEELGFTPNFTILDTDDQQTLLKQLMKSLRIDEKALSVREAQSFISRHKNQLHWPEDIPSGNWSKYLYYNELIELYRAYLRALKEQNSMDFDDILLYSVRLFDDFPEVLDIYRKRFRHLLVDEYQDTNHAQYRVIQQLSGFHKNLTVVGDDDQSIYSFRGANHENILNFEQDFPNCHIIKLEQNYRSTGTILEAANAVIANNQARKEKELWTANVKGEPIQFYRANDQYDEARWVAKEIKRLSTRRENPIAPQEIGIMYRVNALSRNIESALREEGIPYHIYGGVGFYERKEIRDILAYLRLLISEEDRLAFQRVVNTPRRGIGDVTIDRVMDHATAEGKSPLDIAGRASQYPDLAYAASRLQAFAHLIRDMRESMQKDAKSFPEFLRYVAEESGLIPFWETELAKGSLEAESRLQNLEELRSDALEFEARQEEDMRLLTELAERFGDDGMNRVLFEDRHGEVAEGLTLTALTGAFLENTSLYTSADEEEMGGAVSLLTVHSAKGLEFDAAFVVGMEEGIFPGFRSHNSKSEMEEERRLAYVAITRARKHLYLSSARARLLYGRSSYNPVSQFLAEIPGDYIEELGGSRFGDGEYLKEEAGYPGTSFVEKRQWDNPTSSVGQAGTGLSGAIAAKENPFAKKHRPNINKNTMKTKRNLQELAIGTKVRHKRFGEGVLLKIEKLSHDAILSIDFSGKIKHMTAGMAKLDIVDKE